MSHPRITVPSLALLTALFLLISGGDCFAHKMRVFAWEEQDDIACEARFSGGRPARNVKVEVSDQRSGAILLTGETDDDGNFRFPTPIDHGGLLIVVAGSDGHQASWQLAAAPVAAASPLPATDQARLTTTPLDNSTPPVVVSEERLQRLISEAVAAELAPIKRALAENAESSPNLQDILGGIGYLLGLAGIIAYGRAQKKRKNP